ncbi:MAG: glycosyltransferase, partial [Bacteroidales bacterium]|nr:glycosyltransferase [Bacteroidales bacterium]
MERVLLNKATWLAGQGHEVTVVTTDQHGRPTFYPFPAEVRMIDLGVNYSDDNGKPFAAKMLGYLRRRRLHRKRLKALLVSERPDIMDCLYPGECSFVPSIKDGSRKVMELHQSKLFHHQYNRGGLMGLADKYRARTDERLVRRFDRFVVLTEEDRQMWGEMPGIRVIPNAATGMNASSDVSTKRLIAVGRLDYQKSFDRLIEAWTLV